MMSIWYNAYLLEMLLIQVTIDSEAELLLNLSSREKKLTNFTGS